MDEKGLAPVSGKWLHQGPPIRDTREEEQLFKVQNKSEKAGVKESKDHLNSGKCTSSRLKLFMMQSVVVKMSTPSFGPSGVRALPLAAGTNEGGHYFRYWSERRCADGV